MTLVNIVVLLNLAAGSVAAKSVEEVYDFRESDGQKILYLAANEEALIEQPADLSFIQKLLGKKERATYKVNGNEHVVIHEVSITEDENSRDIAEQYIAEGPDTMSWSSYKKFDENHDLNNLTVLEANEIIGDYNVKLQVIAEENQAAHAFIQTTGDQPEFVLEYLKVSENKTLRIFSRSRVAKGNIGDLFNHWQKLVDRYSAS